MITEEEFLDKFIFYDLENLNDGFDHPSIKFFNEYDFEFVMDRAEDYNLTILGIECWVQKQYKTVKYMEDYEGMRNWHRQGYKDLRKEGYRCYFAATYDIPEPLLR